MESNKLLKDKEVQLLLAVSRTYLWRLRKEGKITALKQRDGNRLYYRSSDIFEYINSLSVAD